MGFHSNIQQDIKSSLLYLVRKYKESKVHNTCLNMCNFVYMLGKIEQFWITYNLRWFALLWASWNWNKKRLAQDKECCAWVFNFHTSYLKQTLVWCSYLLSEGWEERHYRHWKSFQYKITWFTNPCFSFRKGWTPFIFFSVREQAVFHKSCNLIGSKSEQYSPHPVCSQRAVSEKCFKGFLEAFKITF